MLRTFKWGFLLVAILALVGILCVIPYILKKADIPESIGLPVVAITGVLVLLAALALVAIAFASMDLSDRTEALALPNGSVRAVIALSLVVLFGILSVYLFSSLNNVSLQNVPCLTSDELAAFVKNLAPGTYTSVPMRTTSTCTSPPASTVLYTVYYQLAKTASEDFAKQLLVLIGTLVTSVAGFYFGAKAVSDAQSNGPGDPPSLTGVSPTAIPPGATVTLSITGANLNNVIHAQLAQGATQINDPNVVSNATHVTAKFAVSDQATGAWDLIVTDDSGRSSRLANAVTVTATAAAPSSDPQAARPPDPTQIAQQASAIQAIASGVKSSLDALIQRTPLTKLQTAITQLGSAGQSLQAQLAAATDAMTKLQASVDAATVDATRAQSAMQDIGAAGGAAAQLKALADRLAQLSADATSASHAFAGALAAYNSAGDAILKQVASG